MRGIVTVAFGAVVAASAALAMSCSTHHGSGAGDDGGDGAASEEGGDARDDGEAGATEDVGNDSAATSDATDQDDGSNGDDGGDAGSDGAVPEAAPFPYALVRFANWSPDAPSVDVCTSPHGTGTFSGPFVAGLLASEGVEGGTLTSSGTPGLPFPSVTSYAYMTPGSYDVRVVAAGASNCSVAVLQDITTPTFEAGAAWTVPLIGTASAGGSGSTRLTMTTFLDEVDTLTGGLLRARFINAAPSLSMAELDRGTSATYPATVIFPAVPFGQAGPQTESGAVVRGVDANGYAHIQTLVNTVLTVEAPGADASVVTVPVSTLTGIPVTFVAVGGSSAAAPLSLIECLDSAGNGDALAECFVETK